MDLPQERRRGPVERLLQPDGWQGTQRVDRTLDVDAVGGHAGVKKSERLTVSSRQSFQSLSPA